VTITLTARTLWIAVPIALALLLGGCTYDYLQHTDRVGYTAGDAVKANIAGETTNPAGSRNVGGLGADGSMFSQAASSGG
jgi:hypothetical protein